MTAYMRQRIKELGCECLADVRWKRQRQKAQQMGWASAFNLYEARLLDLLRQGPKTVREVAAALGIQYRGDGCRAQRVLADMRKRGLVKAVKLKSGGAPLVYSLNGG